MRFFLPLILATSFLATPVVAQVSLAPSDAIRAAPLALQPSVPLPPRRPSGLETSAKTLTEASAAKAVPSLPRTDQEAVETVNAYFNSFSTLVGDFIQFAPNGQRVEGTLSLAKPGRLRFEYQAPSPLEIVADGQSVIVRDRKLNTQDLYPLSQTPLKFLLNDHVNLSKDATLVQTTIKDGIVQLVLEDRSTLGGVSRITLLYDVAANALKQWTILDPQGLETTVALYNIDTTTRPSPKLFSINYDRTLDNTR